MNRFWIGAAAGAALVGAYWLYTVLTAGTPIADAVRDHLVETTAMIEQSNDGYGGTGSGISHAILRITRMSSGNLSIAVPAGTVIVSGNGEGQRLMTATSFVVKLSDDNPSAEQDIEVYCLDEFLPTPTLQSTMSVLSSDQGGGSEMEETPLGKLADCLEGRSEDHTTKQLAVWLVSGGLLQQSSSDALRSLTSGLEDRMLAERRQKLQTEGAAFLRKNHPSFSDSEINSLLDGELNDERDTVHGMAERGAQQEIDKFFVTGKPLLEACGYSASDMPIFS